MSKRTFPKWDPERGFVGNGTTDAIKIKDGKIQYPAGHYPYGHMRCGDTYSWNGGPTSTMTCGHRLWWAGYHQEWCPSFGSPPKPQGQSVDEWAFGVTPSPSRPA